MYEHLLSQLHGDIQKRKSVSHDRVLLQSVERCLPPLAKAAGVCGVVRDEHRLLINYCKSVRTDTGARPGRLLRGFRTGPGGRALSPNRLAPGDLP